MSSKASVSLIASHARLNIEAKSSLPPHECFYLQEPAELARTGRTCKNRQRTRGSPLRIEN